MITRLLIKYELINLHNCVCNAFYENTYLQDKRKFTNAYDYFEYIIDNL